MERPILEEKLTRKMSSGDFANQRILKCIPLLYSLTNEYMFETKNFCYQQCFTDIILDWNNTQLAELKMDIIKNAIFEVFIFDEIIKKIFNEFTENKTITFSQDFFNSLKFDNYKILAKKCRILGKGYNYSKLLNRVKNFKVKLSKMVKGTISVQKFFDEEIVPQKEFMEEFIRLLKQFSTNQFLIFMICYDIRKINESIRR